MLFLSICHLILRAVDYDSDRDVAGSKSQRGGGIARERERLCVPRQLLELEVSAFIAKTFMPRAT